MHVYVYKFCLCVFRQESYKEKQKLAFIAQIKIAVAHNLPIVIHCRDAEQDCWDIMEEVCSASFGFQFWLSDVFSVLVSCLRMSVLVSLTKYIRIGDMESTKCYDEYLEIKNSNSLSFS